MGAAQLTISLALGESRLEARCARPVQRELAAQAVAQAVRYSPERPAAQRLTSISHSRGVALAALLEHPDDGFATLLGCDVEYVDERRRWPEIGAFLTGEKLTGDNALACRAWTLAEAWFKAFQVWPGGSLMRRALAGERPGENVTLASSVHWYAFAPVRGFQASVIWRADPLTPLVLGPARDDATSGSAP